MSTVEILNIKIQNISNQNLLEQLNEGILMPINVDVLMKLQKDKSFYNVYRTANWVVCDSKIIALSLKFLKNQIKEVIPGSSFFPLFYNYHKKNEKIKIFLLGAGPDVAVTAMKKINEKVGRKIIVGAHAPSYGFEKNPKECEDIIQMINKTDATVLVVGVGAPKQEKWIYNYKDKIPNVKLFMALGATIDFEAGNVKRAPKMFQKLALEWLYRMIKDPKRLIKRYLIDDIPFFYYVLQQKFGLYKNPFRE